MQQSIWPYVGPFSETEKVPRWSYYDFGPAGMLVHCSTKPLTIEQLEQLRRVATVSTGSRRGVPSAAEALQLHTWLGERTDNLLFLLAKQKLDELGDCTESSPQEVFHFWMENGVLYQRWLRLPEVAEATSVGSRFPDYSYPVQFWLVIAALTLVWIGLDRLL